MNNKKLKGLITLSLSLLITFATTFQVNATYYVRPTSLNANSGYVGADNVFTSIDKEYYKEDYMKMKIDNIKDITSEFEDRYIKYNNIDKIIKIDYTYTNLQYKSPKLFVKPKIVFNNATVSYSNDSEYIPTELYNQDYDKLEKPQLHPWLRDGETGSWSVVYAIHNKLNGEKHNYININLENLQYDYDHIIWSIPIHDLDKTE